MVEVGERAPDFTLPGTPDTVRLEMLRGKKVVVAFYAEDRTPGCTQQLGAFRDEYAAIQTAGAELIAISADSLESHQGFCEAEGFPFPLASDERLEAATAYGVLGAEGKRSQRAVFVIDEDGIVVHAIPWYQPGNVAQFLEVFQALGVVE